MAAVAGIEAERPRRHAIAGDGSVYESPKQLPSELLRILGLLQKLGLVINPARSVERAHSCSAMTRDRSRVAAYLFSFAGLLPEQSDPRTRQPPRGSDIRPRVVLAASSFAGRLPEWNDPRPRQSPEEWKPAMRLLILPPIAHQEAGQG